MCVRERERTRQRALPMVDVNVGEVGLLHFEDFGAEGALHWFLDVFWVLVEVDLHHIAIGMIRLSGLEFANNQSCQL